MATDFKAWYFDAHPRGWPCWSSRSVMSIGLRRRARTGIGVDVLP